MKTDVVELSPEEQDRGAAIAIQRVQDMKRAADMVREAGRNGSKGDNSRIIVTRENYAMLLRAGVKKIRTMDAMPDEAPLERDKGEARRKRLVAAWIIAHAGEELTTQEIADSMSLSTAAVRARIEADPFSFTKIKRGLYLIRDTDAERTESRSNG